MCHLKHLFRKVQGQMSNVKVTRARHVVPGQPVVFSVVVKSHHGVVKANLTGKIDEGKIDVGKIVVGKIVLSKTLTYQFLPYLFKRM